MEDILNALREAFFWFLEGILGSIAAATATHTEVPWYQCLISSLILVAFAFGSETLFRRWRKAIREKKAERGQNIHD